MNPKTIQNRPLPKTQMDKIRDAKPIIESFIQSIQGIGYQKNDIITIIKEELK